MAHVATGSSFRARSAVSGIVAATVLLLAGVKLAPWWFTWRESVISESQFSRAFAEQAQHYVHAAPMLRDTLAARAARLDTIATHTVAGLLPSAAAADLALVVISHFERAGIALDAVEVTVDSATYRHFYVLGISAAFSSDGHRLIDAVASLESGVPMMRVRDIQVTRHGRDMVRTHLVVQGLALRYADYQPD